MNNYYVLEIQTNADGTSGSLIWGYEDQVAAEDAFLQKQIAALHSSVMIHTVCFMNNKGMWVKPPAYYVHPVETPEEE